MDQEENKEEPKQNFASCKIICMADIAVQKDCKYYRVGGSCTCANWSLWEGMALCCSVSAANDVLKKVTGYLQS